MSSTMRQTREWLSAGWRLCLNWSITRRAFCRILEEKALKWASVVNCMMGRLKSEFQVSRRLGKLRDWVEQCSSQCLSTSQMRCSMRRSQSMGVLRVGCEALSATSWSSLWLHTSSWMRLSCWWMRVEQLSRNWWTCTPSWSLALMSSCTCLFRTRSSSTCSSPHSSSPNSLYSLNCSMASSLCWLLAIAHCSAIRCSSRSFSSNRLKMCRSYPSFCCCNSSSLLLSFPRISNSFSPLRPPRNISFRQCSQFWYVSSLQELRMLSFPIMLSAIWLSFTFSCFLSWISSSIVRKILFSLVSCSCSTLACWLLYFIQYCSDSFILFDCFYSIIILFRQLLLSQFTLLTSSITRSYSLFTFSIKNSISNFSFFNLKIYFSCRFIICSLQSLYNE